MKFMQFIKRSIPSSRTDLRTQIRNLLDREIELGHVTEVTEADCKVLYEQAVVKVAKIRATGLSISVRSDNELRAFLVTRLDGLHPYELAGELGKIGYCVNGEYYGYEPSNDFAVPHPFTESDLGQIFFVVEDKSAKGYRSDMPGSMFTRMKWRDQVAAFADWKITHAAAGKIIALDYASQGLLHLHDSCLPDWNNNALGRVGHNRFIEQPTNGNKHFPFGDADCGDARWLANDWDSNADGVFFAVVALVG